MNNIEEILQLQENKTLEFKVDTSSLTSIIKTVVAFANTAGGTLVLGIKDKTREVVGIQKPLLEEERVASAIADSITPFIFPDIEIQTYRDRELIVIHIPHMVGPYYVKASGPEKGVYIRFGSTNRVVDAATLANMKLLAQYKSFDELPYIHEKSELDWDVINQSFRKVGKEITHEKAELLGLIAKHGGSAYPSYGGIILFGKDRLRIFPDAMVRCARFLGISKAHIHDHADITSYPILALDEAIRFVERNTSLRAEIGRLYRTNMPEYPPVAVRESIVNALLHADYAARGSTIMVAIFDDRMEITNPGNLMFGMTLKRALAGASVLRNHVIAHTFRELQLIERWGSGLQRILEACRERGLKTPTFEERENEFIVTLYSTQTHKIVLDSIQKNFLDFLKHKERVSSKEAAEFWGVTSRSALMRLNKLLDLGLVKRIGTSTNDPHSKYILVRYSEVD